MSSLTDIQDFLAQKRIAVIGVGRDPRDFNHKMFQSFREFGYDAVPVNPNAREVGGMPCFSCVQEIDPPVDAVLIMTPPDTTDTVAKDCVEAGVKRVWMYRATGAGAVSQAAVELCRKNGIRVVDGNCPYMFLPNASWFHHFHGFLVKITGNYPK